MAAQSSGDPDWDWKSPTWLLRSRSFRMYLVWAGLVNLIQRPVLTVLGVLSIPVVVLVPIDHLARHFIRGWPL